MITNPKELPVGWEIYGDAGKLEASTSSMYCWSAEDLRTVADVLDRENGVEKEKEGDP